MSRRDNFVKRRKVAERLGKSTSLKKGTGGINPCYRPAKGASKADLAEYHAENMGLRRAHQLSRHPNVRQPRDGSIATGNRHGGEHQHKREIARRGDQ